MSNIEYWSIALETLFPSLEESIRSGRAQVNMVNIGAGWKYSDWFYADLTSNFDSNGNECYADGLWAKSEELSPTDYVTDSGIDFTPDVAVGRIPTGDPDLVAEVLAASMGFERSLPNFKHGWPICYRWRQPCGR